MRENMYYSNILVLIVILSCIVWGEFCAYSCIRGKQHTFLVLFYLYPHFHHVYTNTFAFSIIVKFVLQQQYMYFPHHVDTFVWRRHKISVCMENTRSLHFKLFYKFLGKMCNIQHFFTFLKVADFQKNMGKCT